MEDFLVYLIKATMGLTVFAVLFRLLIIRETFFRFTRIVMIIGLVIFSVLPLIKINTVTTGIINQTFINFEETLLAQASDMFGGSSGAITIIPAEASVQNNMQEAIKESPANSSQISGLYAVRWISVIVFIYIGGLVFMIARLAFSLVRVRQIIMQGREERINGFKLVVTVDEIIPFSFFHNIVISAKDYNDNPREIILHEQMHIIKKHNIDIVISELLLIIHWFNPMMWMLCRDLSEIHEYEADDAVINSGIDVQKYQLLLVKKAVGERRFTSVVNSFNHSKIKNRITMMLKTESNPLARFKVLFIVPLAAVMLLAFAAPENEDLSQAVVINQPSQSVVDQVQSNPLFYCEQLQNYYSEKGMSFKDLKESVTSNDNEQKVIILINSVNQVMYQNGKSTDKIMNQEEVNSIISVYKLRSMIVEAAKPDRALPVYFLFTHDTTSSSHVIFNFLSNTLPEAYEMAIADISKRDNKSVNQLKQEMPLLLLHQIPRNYSNDEPIVNKNERGDSDKSHTFFSISVYRYGDDSDIALVSVTAEAESNNLIKLKENLEDKLNIEKMFFVPTFY